MQIKIPYLLAVLSVLLFITSCSNSLPDKKNIQNPSDANNKNTEKLTLRFVSSWGGNDTNSDTLQYILDDFMNNNPDIKIVNDSMFGDDFLSKLKTDFASGNDPDVFGLWPGLDIKNLINAGKVADITEEINNDPDWKNSFDEQAWCYTTFGGRIFGLPFERIYEGLFINKDMFTQFNIKIPENYNDLLTAIDILKTKGITPIAYNSSPEGTYIYQALIAAIGGKEVVTSPFNENGVNECYIKAMEYMIDLYRRGAFPKNAFTMSSNERNDMFINKNAAMIVQGSWFTGRFKENCDWVDFIMFPSISNEKKGHMIHGLGSGVFYVSKTAWNDENKKEACIKLLKALTSKKSAEIFSQKVNMYTIVKVDTANMGYSKIALKGLEEMKKASELIDPPDSCISRSIWEGIIVKQFPYVLEGTIKPKEVWDLAFNQYLEEQKH